MTLFVEVWRKDARNGPRLLKISLYVYCTSYTPSIYLIYWLAYTPTPIPTYVQGREGKQVRERWFNYLDPKLNHGPFTDTEDAALQAAVQEHGTKWSKIAQDVMLGRSENALKNRYHSLRRKAAQPSKSAGAKRSRSGTRRRKSKSTRSSASTPVTPHAEPQPTSAPNTRLRSAEAPRAAAPITPAEPHSATRVHSRLLTHETEPRPAQIQFVGAGGRYSTSPILLTAHRIHHSSSGYMASPGSARHPSPLRSSQADASTLGAGRAASGAFLPISAQASSTQTPAGRGAGILSAKPPVSDMPTADPCESRTSYGLGTPGRGAPLALFQTPGAMSGLHCSPSPVERESQTVESLFQLFLSPPPRSFTRDVENVVSATGAVAHMLRSGDTRASPDMITGTPRTGPTALVCSTPEHSSTLPSETRVIYSAGRPAQSSSSQAALQASPLPAGIRSAVSRRLTDS